MQSHKSSICHICASTIGLLNYFQEAGEEDFLGIILCDECSNLQEIKQYIDTYDRTREYSIDKAKQLYSNFLDGYNNLLELKKIAVEHRLHIKKNAQSAIKYINKNETLLTLKVLDKKISFHYAKERGIFKIKELSIITGRSEGYLRTKLKGVSLEVNNYDRIKRLI